MNEATSLPCYQPACTEPRGSDGQIERKCDHYDTDLHLTYQLELGFSATNLQYSVFQ